jgi:hypothetical protein
VIDLALCARSFSAPAGGAGGSVVARGLGVDEELGGGGGVVVERGGGERGRGGGGGRNECSVARRSEWVKWRGVQ